MSEGARRRSRRAASGVDYTKFYQPANFITAFDDSSTQEFPKTGNDAGDYDTSDDDIQIIEVRPVNREVTGAGTARKLGKSTNRNTEKPFGVIQFNPDLSRSNLNSQDSNIHVKREFSIDKSDDDDENDNAEDEDIEAAPSSRRKKQMKITYKPMNQSKALADSSSMSGALVHPEAIVGFIDETEKVKRKAAGVQEENWKSFSISDVQRNLEIKNRRKELRKSVSNGVSRGKKLEKSKVNDASESEQENVNSNSDQSADDDDDLEINTESDSDDNFDIKSAMDRNTSIRKAANKAAKKIMLLSSNQDKYKPVPEKFGNIPSDEDSTSEQQHSLTNNCDKSAKLAKISNSRRNNASRSLKNNEFKFQKSIPFTSEEEFRSSEDSDFTDSDDGDKLPSVTLKPKKVVDPHTRTDQKSLPTEISRINGSLKKKELKSSGSTSSIRKTTTRKAKRKRSSKSKKQRVSKNDSDSVQKTKLQKYLGEPLRIESMRNTVDSFISESNWLDPERLNSRNNEGIYGGLDHYGTTAKTLNGEFGSKMIGTKAQNVKVWKQILPNHIEDYCETLNDLNNNFAADLPLHLYCLHLLKTRNPLIPPPEISAWPLASKDLITPRQAIKSTTLNSLGKEIVHYKESIESDRYSYVRFRENKHRRPGAFVMYEYWHPKVDASNEMMEALDSIYEKRLNHQISCLNEEASTNPKEFIFQRSNEEDIHLPTEKKKEIMNRLDNLIDKLIEVHKDKLQNEKSASRLLKLNERPRGKTPSFGLDWMTLAGCVGDQHFKDNSLEHLCNLFSLKLRKNFTVGPTTGIHPGHFKFADAKIRKDKIVSRVIHSKGKPIGTQLKSKFDVIFKKNNNKGLRTSLKSFAKYLPESRY